MSATYTLLQQLNTPSGTVSQTISTTGEAVVEMDVAIPAASNTQVNLGFPYANVKMIWMNASVAMTLKTNSSSEPDQTISLAAGVPQAWITGGHGSNPITDDVAAIYVTAAAEGTLSIRCLYDPTPSV
jgi:hypothetical protein